MNRTDDEPRAFIDSIPVLAWSSSPDGPAVSFNRRWLDYTGLTEEVAGGWGWTVAMHPDDLPKLLEVFKNALDTGRPFDAEAERSNAEEALHKSEERWRAVFENSAIGVALTDIGGRFLATNAAYQKTRGYSEEEIRHLTFLELTRGLSGVELAACH